MKKQSKICLACPRSCNLRPQIEGMPGQKLCPQGQKFLEQESREPLRHFFATVRQPDGKLYSYRTLEPIAQQQISSMCEKLRMAASAKQRNDLHLSFCEQHQVRMTCIDLDGSD